MTISDIAELAGVSRAAVSRYLNNGYLSEEKRIRIAEVIEKTGYQPSSQAQMLRTRRTKIIGVIIPKIDSDSISQIVAGISEVLSENGYQMLLANTENQAEKELEYLNTFRQHSVDGVILLGSILTPKHESALRRLEIPRVILGQKTEHAPCVYHDDYGAAEAVTAYMLKKGHRQIGYIGVTEKDIAVGYSRRQGFLDVMDDHGIEVPSESIRTGAFHVDNGYENIQKLCTAIPDLDAVICATDTIALGVIKYLNHNGIRIPEDIAVSGFGDSKASSVLMPSLTTVHFYYRESGVEGARLLLEKIENPDTPDKSIRLGFELIENESV